MTKSPYFDEHYGPELDQLIAELKTKGRYAEIVSEDYPLLFE